MKVGEEYQLVMSVRLGGGIESTKINEMCELENKREVICATMKGLVQIGFSKDYKKIIE